MEKSSVFLMRRNHFGNEGGSPPPRALTASACQHNHRRGENKDKERKDAKPLLRYFVMYRRLKRLVN
jgi:hypothetical protein